LHTFVDRRNNTSNRAGFRNGCTVNSMSRIWGSHILGETMGYRSGAGRDDLLCFYGTVIRPVLEYACPVWHTSLTAAQTKALESLQRRALCIIYEDGDYNCVIANQSRVRHAGGTARTTDRALLQTQCSPRDVVLALIHDLLFLPISTIESGVS